MLKIAKNNATRELQTLLASNIPFGTLFQGSIGGGPDRVYLSAYNGIVDLEKPSATYTTGTFRNVIELDGVLTVTER